MCAAPFKWGHLTEQAKEVVDVVLKKFVQKNSVSYVAVVGAKKLDSNHALEVEHAGLVLLSVAETGLRQVLSGQRISPAELDRILAD
jgi:hypothetical protein